MFGSLFGGKRKLTLIRELVERRMRFSGFDDMESSLKLKRMGNLQLLGTPEGTIVTIAETTLMMQKRGERLFDILAAIETHRRRLGGNDEETFRSILRLADGPKWVIALLEYCVYRVELEHYGVLSRDQVETAIVLAVPEITKWLS